MTLAQEHVVTQVEGLQHRLGPGCVGGMRPKPLWDRMVISVSGRTVSFHAVRVKQVKKRDGNISRYTSNGMLVADAIATPGAQAFGAECFHGQGGEHK